MNQKRRISLILVLCMVLSLMLSACGPNANTTTGGDTTTAPISGKVKYQVTILDPSGNPFTNSVAVRFMQNGGQVGMQTTDANGVAAKELERGDYTVVLEFTDKTASFDYEGEDVTLSATKTELTIQVYNGISYSRPYSLNVKLDATTQTYNKPAYDVVEGMTRVKLTAGERNFFVFTPTRGGVYEFRIGDGQKVGVYGTTQYSSHISTDRDRESDRCCTFNIRNSDVGDSVGTNQMLIGIDAGEATDTMLTITRISDPDKMLSYDIYSTTTKLTAYKHPAGAQIENIDVFAASGTYNLVYNEADGFYHLNAADGPLVLIRLGKASDPSYEDGATNGIEKCPYLASLESLAAAPINRVYYNEDGEAVRGENYVPCINEHVPYADEATGFYPLTKELEHILKEYGEYKGWWDPVTRPNGENNYLFSGGTVNEEYAWLFNCCYIVD